MSKRFHELTTPPTALTGSEPTNLEQLSATVTITASTISFTASDNSINDSGAGLIAAGFAVGKSINVAGAAAGANNLYSGRIFSLTASKMVITAPEGDAIVNGTAGPSITIKQWDSYRTTLQEIADLASTAGGGGSPITYTVDTGSTADSDPGAGLLKFNNASQPAATMIYIDNATADAVTLTTLLASLAQTGFLTLVQADDPTYWRIYKITAVTSATGYYKLTVVNQAGSASDFADAVSVLLAFDSDASTAAFTGGTLTTSLNEAPTVTIASASTVNIGSAAANSILVTGTTTITAFDTLADGALRRLTFSGVLTLTHNATSLILPTGANIATAAGDCAMFKSLGSGNWRCVSYMRASGAALVSASFTGGTLSSALNEAPAVTPASASTVNIGAAAGNTINVTGTTTITSFDSIADGALRRVVFGGILTLTHNGTSLILPTAANLTTAAGDSAVFLSLGSGNWQCLGYARANGRPLVNATECLTIACSDETTALTTGTAKVTFRMPYAFTLSAVRSSVTTAPTGSTFIVDINESGTTILSTKLSIDASEKTSTTAASAAVISDASLADDAEITIDFDQVGSTVAGAGAKVYLIGVRT